MEDAKRYAVCLIHMADPRGRRIGGTETYVRDYIRHHPADMDLLYIGPDEIGDLELGRVSAVECAGRRINYLALYRVESSLNVWADSIARTDTFTLARALLKNWPKVRRVLRQGGYSVELRRVEIAPLVQSFGVPFVQMQHVMATKGEARSGVLARYPVIGTVAAGLAAAGCYRFYLVNEDMTAACRRRFRPFARKFETLTTWADPEIFRPSAFPGGPLKLVFAGRADAFKRLDVMLDVVRRVAEQSRGAVEFHYVGDGDLESFAQFAAVRQLTTRHGRTSAGELATLLRGMHVGLLTSAFEGMPRFVMETLASGRCVVALQLPQLAAVISAGVNGYLVDRDDDAERQNERFAARVLEIYGRMMRGETTPEAVAGPVRRFTPARLLGRIFDDHRALHGLPPNREAP